MPEVDPPPRTGKENIPTTFEAILSMPPEDKIKKMIKFKGFSEPSERHREWRKNSIIDANHRLCWGETGYYKSVVSFITKPSENATDEEKQKGMRAEKHLSHFYADTISRRGTAQVLEELVYALQESIDEAERSGSDHRPYSGQISHGTLPKFTAR